MMYRRVVQNRFLMFGVFVIVIIFFSGILTPKESSTDRQAVSLLAVTARQNELVEDIGNRLSTLRDDANRASSQTVDSLKKGEELLSAIKTEHNSNAAVLKEIAEQVSGLAEQVRKLSKGIEMPVSGTKQSSSSKEKVAPSNPPDLAAEVVTASASPTFYPIRRAPLKIKYSDPYTPDSQDVAYGNCRHFIDFKTLWKDMQSLDHVTQTETSPSFLINHYAKADDMISNFLYENGHWELNHLHVISIVSNDTKRNNRKDTFIDMGANMGFISLYAAASGFRVFAFEPMPRNLIKFCYSIYLNGFQNLVSVFPFGLSDERSAVTFSATRDQFNLYMQDEAGKLYEVVRKNSVDGVAPSGRVKVELIPFDNVVITDPKPRPPNELGFVDTIPLSDIIGNVFVKIDVENWEYFVYQGAKKFFEDGFGTAFSSNRIRNILLEYQETAGYPPPIEDRRNLQKSLIDQGFIILTTPPMCKDTGVCKVMAPATAIHERYFTRDLRLWGNSTELIDTKLFGE